MCSFFFKKIKPFKFLFFDNLFLKIIIFFDILPATLKSSFFKRVFLDDKALSSRNTLLKKDDLSVAGKISKKIIIFKKRLSKNKNLKGLIFLKKNEHKKKYDIKIDYLELRDTKNLKLANKIKNAKIFIAYYINKVRLIDNF